MKHWGAASLLLFFSQWSVAADVTPSLWRDAVSLYYEGSTDYQQTAAETLDEYRFLRQKVLRDHFEEKITHLEEVLSKSNNEVLAELEKYAATNGIDSLDDVLLMRLAQLNYDRANFDLNEKLRTYDNEITQFQAGHRKSMPVVPEPDYRKTVFYVSKLMKDFPNSALDDRAHYLLAYCRSEEGKEVEAANIYAELIKLHPFSEVAAESRWRLAEYYFDSDKFNDALFGYKILAETTNAFSEKALYKEGATYFAIGKYPEALQIFINLLNRSSKRLGSSDPDAATFYDESIDYLAHLRAKNIKFTLDEVTDALVTERLAQAYRHNHDDEAARATLMSFVTNHGTFKAAPRFMNDIIQSYEDRGEHAKAQVVRNRLVASLGSESPFWAKYRADVSVTVETQDLYEAHTLASAQFYGDQARRTKRGVDYAAALSFYQQFIARYPSSPFRTQAVFEKGELEYADNKFENAAASYATVVGAVGDSEYREDAAYGYVLAVAKAASFPLEEQEAIKPQRTLRGDLAPASAPMPSEKAFIGAVNFYVNAIPKGSHRQKILYRAAEVLFKHNQFAAVRQNLELILKEKEDSGLFIDALRMIAVTHDLENNVSKLAEANNRLLGAEPTADVNAVGMDSVATVGSGGLTSAWHIETSGQIGEAAAEYERYAITYPKAPDAAFALFHAGILYRQTVQYAASDRIFAKLIRDYPKSTYVPQAEFFGAANAQSLLKFDEAAEAYEKFADKYPKHFLSTQAFLNAGIIYKDLFLFAKAAKNYERYGHRVLNDEVYFEAAHLYEKAKNLDGAAQIYNRYISGKYGRDLYVRGLFQRAKLTAGYSQDAHAYAKAMIDCFTVGSAEKKYANTLGAKALQAINGCRYLQTEQRRDILLGQKQAPPDLDGQLQGLVNKYAEIQKMVGSEYAFLSYFDEAAIYENLASLKTIDAEKAHAYLKKSQANYTKAYELRETIENTSLVTALVEKLRAFAPETVALYNQDMFWAASAHDGRVIQVAWPASGHPLKVLYDSRKWAAIETEIAALNKADFTPTLFMARARAQAEQGQWTEARASLTNCVSQFKDPQCAADLLLSGYAGGKMVDYKDIVEAASKNETHSSWKVALAGFYARQKKGREALALAQEAVAEDVQYAPAYTFLSQLYLESRRSEMARLTLEEAVKNTDDDEELNVQLGLLEINAHLIERSQRIADQFSDLDGVSGRIQAFLARQNFAKGNDAVVTSALSKWPGIQPDKTDVVTAKLYFAVLKRDKDGAAKAYELLAPTAAEFVGASFMAGIYNAFFKSDNAKAQAYWTYAREQGAWGTWIEAGNLNTNPNRTPSEERR